MDVTSIYLDLAAELASAFCVNAETRSAAKCEGKRVMWNRLLHRRDALRVGGLAAAASLLPASIRAEQKSAGSTLPPTADSVIFLNMMGGVTHHEVVRPKPDAPEDVRGTLSPIATSLTGLQFAEVCRTWPRSRTSSRSCEVIRIRITTTS